MELDTLRDEGLANRVAEVLGQPSVQLDELPPGTSRGAIRVLSPDGTPIAFLRVDLGSHSAGSESLSLAQEIEFVKSAFRLGFPVPEVYGMLDDPPVAVMELARGTARPDEAEIERVAPEFMGHIARLHQVDPNEFGVKIPSTISEAIAVDLDEWVADAERRGITENALVRLGLRVLRHTLPKSDAPPSMLHGDVGAGNFMVEDGKVSAILDWELAHAGDIHEDLAWLWVRGAHTAFGNPYQRIDEYEKVAGARIDPQRLAWHIAFVTFKSVIGLKRRVYADGDDPGLLMIQIASLAYDTLFCAALADILGVELSLFEEAPVARNILSARLLDRLSVATPPENRESEILLKYLRDSAAQSEWEAQCFREESQALLGLHPDDLDAFVDQATPEQFGALVQVMADATSRHCQALPNAERRVKRALAIGYGAIGKSNK